MNGDARGVPTGGFAAADAAIAGFFAAALLPRAAQPLIDPDVWWHIRAGEEVLRTGSVPDRDTWSLVAQGQEWTSQDWLTNVLLAVGNDAGGWGLTALSLLFGGLALGAFWILWRAIAVRDGSIGWASRVVWLSLGLLLAGPVLGVRAQVVDLLLSAAVIYVCWRYVTERRGAWLFGLPLIAAAWANLHAGWILLFLLAGAVLVGEAADRLAGRRLEGPVPLGWTNLRDLAVALVVSVLALALNPNGIDLYAYPFETIGIVALNRYVLEWYSATLDNIFGWLLLGFTLLGVVPALIFGRRRLRSADALILVGLTIMAWQAIRFLLILGPIGGAIIAAVLAPAVSRTRLGRSLSPILVRLARPRTGVLGRINAALVVLVVVAGAGITLARIHPEAQQREIAERLPVAAVDWMDANEPGDRMFNRYEWGGYIGQRRPSQPIFMDGRADVYGNELLEMYVSVIGVRGDPQTVLDRYAIDHVIIPPDWELAGWMNDSEQWRQAYADEVAAIWVRR